MQLTLGQAAKQIGVTKPTLSKAIKSNKLSASRNEDGSYSIDTSELFRYHDANKHRFHGNGQATGEDLRLETLTELPATPKATGLEIDNARLAERVKALEELKAQMQDSIDDLKSQRDKAQARADELDRRLLTHQSPAPAGRRGLFGWFKKAG